MDCDHGSEREQPPPSSIDLHFSQVEQPDDACAEDDEEADHAALSQQMEGEVVRVIEKARRRARTGRRLAQEMVPRELAPAGAKNRRPRKHAPRIAPELEACVDAACRLEQTLPRGDLKPLGRRHQPCGALRNEKGRQQT